MAHLSAIETHLDLSFRVPASLCCLQRAWIWVMWIASTVCTAPLWLWWFGFLVLPASLAALCGVGGPCCLTDRLLPTALSDPQAHCCCVTSSPSQSWAQSCCTTAMLAVCFQVFLGGTVSLLNSPLVVHQGSNHHHQCGSCGLYHGSPQRSNVPRQYYEMAACSSFLYQ